MIKKFIATTAALMLLFTAYLPQTITVQAGNKPDDYNKVLAFEDYEGSTSKIAFETDGEAAKESGDTTAVSSKEQGKYINFKTCTKQGNVYYRPLYGSNGTVQKTGVPVADFSKTQVSFDICPMVISSNYLMRGYEKYSDTSAAKSETIITLKTDGTITFAGSTSTSTYTLKKWITIDLFFDFTADTYDAYIDGVLIAEDATLSTLTECIESFGPMTDSRQGDFSLYFDNLRIAIPDKIRITESTPANESTDTEVTDTISFTVSNEMKNFSSSSVSILCNGEALAADKIDNITEENRVVTIKLKNVMSYESTYTVKLLSGIKDIYGQELKEDLSFSFATKRENQAPPNPGETPDPGEQPENPEATKPVDYNKVIAFEDYEGDSNKIVFETDGEATKESGDTTAVSSKDQGKYINFKTCTKQGNVYYRPSYGSNGTVQKTGVTLAELKKTQVSFDICPVTISADYRLRGYEKYSDSSAVKQETIITLKTDGTITFAGSTSTSTYTLKKWITIDLFFDFTSGTYDAYIDGVLIAEDATLSTLTECIESFGPMTDSRQGDFSLYFDNLRIAIPEKFAVSEVYPINGSTGVSVMENPSFRFSNSVSDVSVSDISVFCNDEVVSSDKYEIITQGNSATIKFKDKKMEFGARYFITASTSIKDIYGQNLSQSNSFTYNTMQEQLIASTPELADKVTASAYNPYEAPATIILVVTVVNEDGTSTVYTDEKVLGKGETAEFSIDYDVTTKEDGQVVTAYMAESIDSLKPMTNSFAVSGGMLDSKGTSQAKAIIEKSRILRDEVFVKGSLSVKEKQTVIITVSDKDGKVVMAVPKETESDGSFEHSYPDDDMPFGEYSVCVTGYKVSECVAKKYEKLNPETKTSIKEAFNGANTAAKVQSLMQSYKSKLCLDENLYNENTYNVVSQHVPYGDYDSVIELIFKADELKSSLNSSDWSGYSKLLTENSSVMLHGSQQLSIYIVYSGTKQNIINKKIVEHAPYETFNLLCDAFDNAVEEYIQELNSQQFSDGGGGSGGGRGSSSKGEIEISSPLVSAPQNSNLFVDVKETPWAESHVQLLHSKGIISSAKNYRPLDNVTREEFVKMLVQLAGLETSGDAQFSDVKGTEWFAPYLAAAQNAGIINGMADGKFGVGERISRQDMVVMAYRAVQIMKKSFKENNEAGHFADYASISGYAQEAVINMQRAGVVSGMGNGCFEPLGATNRAQAAVVICNLINALN